MPQDASSSDDRAFPRVLTEVRVDLRDASQLLRSQTEDLSEGGLFIQMDSPPAIGTELDGLVRVGDHGPVHATFTVRWVRETSGDPDLRAGVGVSVSGLDAEDRRRVQAFLDGS